MNCTNVISISCGAVVGCSAYGVSYMLLATPVIGYSLIKSKECKNFSCNLTPELTPNQQELLSFSHVVSMNIGVGSGIVAERVTRFVCNKIQGFFE